MVLEKAIKVKLLKLQIKKGKSVVKTQQAFKVFYKTKSTALDTAKNMVENGYVGRRVYSKRAKTVRTPENIT